jgi:7-cyano-7-deazaguanine synthase
MKRATVLLSGGIDSATSLAIAESEGFELYALSFDYGQRHKRELESARLTANRMRVVKHLVIHINLREIGGSALTSDIQVPKDRLLSGDSHDTTQKVKSQGVPVTYVPARNTIFLSFALSWAESIGSSDIFIGANAIDYSGYPDCRPEYLRAFEALANLATKASVEEDVTYRIHAPLLHLTKSEIITRAVSLHVDLASTWSCYDPVSGQYPCLRCDSCLLRAKGFREAGLEDPLLLKVKHL